MRNDEATMRILAPLLLVTMCSAQTLSAQESRVEALEGEIADKARQVEPYQPGKLERVMLYIEESNLLGRLSSRPDGWYPRLGGLTTGSGFAIGPGYRKYFGRDGVFETSAAASLKSYRAVDTHLRFPSFAADRLGIELGAGWRYYPQERFFGLGRSSSSADRASYLFEDVTAFGGVMLWPNSPLRGGARLAYTTTHVDSGSGRFPSIETVFSANDVPGLAEQPEYLQTVGYIELDYRDFPGNPRSGGRHRLTVSAHRDQDFGRYSFRRVDAEAMQLFPFLDKRRVIALRVVAAATDASRGSDVPFYSMPFVGGPETLRGFRERRFTDRSLLLFNAEYRYEVLAALDMALFVDAGTVAPRLRDLSLADLKTDYGVGFRFGTRSNLMLRVDIGFGGEGTRYFIKFGPVF
jgi:outer membrane protein assembly factor BamA